MTEPMLHAFENKILRRKYMIQYKRMGSGTLEGVGKFVSFKRSKYSE